MCANGRHDLIYVTSYIHDAQFYLNDVQQRGRSMIIPLNRARWELFRVTNELDYIRSELTIRPIKYFQLELVEELSKQFLESPKLIISGIQVISDLWRNCDDQEIVIDCVFNHKLRLRVGNDFRIRIVDTPK